MTRKWALHSVIIHLIVFGHVNTMIVNVSSDYIYLKINHEPNLKRTFWDGIISKSV